MNTQGIFAHVSAVRLFIGVCALGIALAAGGCRSGSGRTIIECGGGAKFRCPEGYFCSLGPRCGGIDRKGQCAYQPTECPSDKEVVCGCDDQEYDNECLANGAGVSVAYPGPCLKK